MANRYGGITGSKKISEDFNNINVAFDKVQGEMDTNKQAVDTHIGNADIHTSAAEKTKLASIASGAGKDGSATDAVIGSRTITDAEAPTGDTGAPTKLWSWLAYMIKAITGKSSWRTAPATTLEAAKAHADNTDIHVTKAEHTKLAGIDDGAQVNQFAFAAINTIMATSPSDTVTFENGTGISITYNPTTKKITWTATGESTPGPHGGSHDPDGSDPIPALEEIIEAFNAHKTDPNAHPYYAKADDLATLAASLANKANTSYVDTQVSTVDGKVTNLKSDVAAHLADYAKLKDAVEAKSRWGAL